MWLKFFSTQKLLENLAPDDIVIVVIGPIGVGKSSFINLATDKNLQVGGGMSPCTKEIAYVRYRLPDAREVVFVDTPAFPNPDIGMVKLSDLEKKEGKKIREWINNAFGKRIKITGILYLHRMTDNRLTEPLPHYEIFRKLCGDQFKGSVALVLTMCEEVNPTFQASREHVTAHWKGVMSENAVVCSHYGTVESAWDVVAALGVEGPFPSNMTKFYQKEAKLFTQSFHSTTLPKLQASVYSALTTFEPGISPWTHPSEWLDSNAKHIRSIFDGIVDLTENAYIKTIPFPAPRIYQRLSVYLFAHIILCSRDETLLYKLKATWKKCQDWDMLNLMRNQATLKKELLNVFNRIDYVVTRSNRGVLDKLVVLDWIALSANIELLISDEDNCEELAETEDDGAQSLVNVLYARLDCPIMDPAKKDLLVQLLTRLSETWRLHPESLTLTNVTRVNIYGKEFPQKLDTRYFHATTLPQLQATVYSALTIFEPGISHWTHPSEWLDSNEKHMRSIFDGIVDFTESAYIKTLPFPATRIYQRFSLYIFAHNIMCARKEGFLAKLNATLEKYQDWDMLNLMRNQANVKNELLNLFRNASPVDHEIHLPDLLNELVVLDSIALSANMELLLSDEETCEELAETEGAGAQSLVNILHARLDFPMDPANKDLLVRALTRLSERSGLYPESLTLTDVTPERGRRATGGFADVYKGICLDEDIALKVFKIPLPFGVNSLNSWRSSDHRFQSLIHEVITWRQLSHPNVLPFYGVHFLEDPLEIRFCLVSPWMENGNVVEFLALRNRMAPYTDTTDCVSLALDIVHGVKYLHGEKVIHRDLKGSNILISPSMRACIADFGLATSTDSGSATTLVGSAIMGTPRWLAPELIPHQEVKVKRHHTFASDIYAFALVCYEMFFGKIPFEDVEVYGSISLMQRGERPSLSADDLSGRRGLNPKMEELIQDCWNQEPAKRPSADEVVGRLQLLCNHQDDQRAPNEIGHSFFVQLLSSQVDNPFAILSRDHRFGVRA